MINMTTDRYYSDTSENRTPRLHIEKLSTTTVAEGTIKGGYVSKIPIVSNKTNRFLKPCVRHTWRAGFQASRTGQQILPTQPLHPSPALQTHAFLVRFRLASALHIDIGVNGRRRPRLLQESHKNGRLRERRLGAPLDGYGPRLLSWNWGGGAEMRAAGYLAF